MSNVDIAYFILRTSIGLVCLWAALSKIFGFRAFVASVFKLGITPRRFSKGIAVGIIASESLVSVAMLADVEVRLASIGAAALFATFAGGALIAIRRGRSAPCHCFGAADGDVASWTTVIRAATLMLGSVGLVGASMTSHGSPPQELVLPGLTITLAFVLSARFSSLIPLAIRSFRLAPPAGVPPTRRVSFRHLPLESSLRQSPRGGPLRPSSSLSIIEPRGPDAVDVHG